MYSYKVIHLLLPVVSLFQVLLVYSYITKSATCSTQTTLTYTHRATQTHTQSQNCHSNNVCSFRSSLFRTQCQSAHDELIHTWRKDKVVALGNLKASSNADIAFTTLAKYNDSSMGIGWLNSAEALK